MEHNIQACLNFLLAKGVSVQDIQAKEIREGNLKAILGLFFQLSRYKQQQKMLQQQPTGKNSTLLFTFEHVVMFIYRHGLMLQQNSLKQQKIIIAVIQNNFLVPFNYIL